MRIAFLCCFTLACWGTLIFWCLPVAAFWDVSLRRLPTTYCYPQVHFTNISLMNTSFNMFTDVLLATLPVHIIWTLQINQRQKISLIAVLSLGYAAVGLGVVKAIKQVELPKDPDATWYVFTARVSHRNIKLTILAHQDSRCSNVGLCPTQHRNYRSMHACPSSTLHLPFRRSFLAKSHTRCQQPQHALRIFPPVRYKRYKEDEKRHNAKLWR